VVNAKTEGGDDEIDKIKDQLSHIVMKCVMQNKASGLAGGNLFYSPGAHYGQQTHPHQNMFNPAAIFQLAANSMNQ
jgi:hypothetical protein